VLAQAHGPLVFESYSGPCGQLPVPISNQARIWEFFTPPLTPEQGVSGRQALVSQRPCNDCLGSGTWTNTYQGWPVSLGTASLVSCRVQEKEGRAWV
jgi:hypothetical protein